MEKSIFNWHDVSSIDPEIYIVELLNWLIMKRETLKQDQASQLSVKDRNQQKNQQSKIVPQTGNTPNATDTGGSMSEGNLSNSRYSRERTRLLRDKQFIMGSDSDGQAN
ncbi:hypothetical protein LZZ85_01355 [Terrimonas sp. NA20]|uniref:Uncharacterized protein n=1 Tax=Terrimonas ginsenosidimutans TaxID=2908004 RepID=A0ABS9KKN6_9BACT|nr:hypothetical protein [Terrimonas ginsenosidimutans]MCG2612898.1 hypothetical protein [Terrimonas ginsenosidimutans]